MKFDHRELDPTGKSKGVRGSHVAIAVVAATGIAVYYAIYKPLFLQPEKYQRMQKEARKDIDQKAIQPGGMRVWSNPYKPLPKEE